MDEVPELDLAAYSAALSRAVENAGSSVVAVKSASYRVTSGVIFRPDLIAVNNHLLRRSGNIPVQLPDGNDAEATILGRDAAVDVAVLKIAGANLPVPKIEDESARRPGSLIVVVGRTVDVGLSASAGILGAVGGPRRTWRGGTLDQFLRLDVNLYPSQAGAGVFSARGGLLGMATPAILRHSALAVPPSTLNSIADELLTEGGIRQGYLGVGLQPVAIPENLRVKSPLAGASGLMVVSVEPGSAAEKSGLQLGDTLIAAGNVPLTYTESLLGALRGNVIGKPIKFTVLRAGEIITVEIEIGSRPERKN